LEGALAQELDHLTHKVDETVQEKEVHVATMLLEASVPTPWEKLAG